MSRLIHQRRADPVVQIGRTVEQFQGIANVVKELCCFPSADIVAWLGKISRPVQVCRDLRGHVILSERKAPDCHDAQLRLAANHHLAGFGEPRRGQNACAIDPGKCSQGICFGRQSILKSYDRKICRRRCRCVRDALPGPEGERADGILRFHGEQEDIIRGQFRNICQVENPQIDLPRLRGALKGEAMLPDMADLGAPSEKRIVNA
ncbi:hypothetical protein D3C86_1135580 [compost metagenome]